jgi:hypothetical protein
VPRDPIRIPTFAAGTDRSNFVWTVSKQHQENDADRVIRARAAEILAAYTRRRARYVGDGKAGAFGLLRDWYCESGRCYVPEVFR